LNISILIRIKINKNISKMPTEFKRKLYKRGSSFETTIPMPLLFALDKDKKYNVIFLFDADTNKWYIKFEPIENK
ncbi:MAG TPA: hypothetical protein QF458_04425, partial [Candidatus Woesearchaeota archaeon]|nr:hypothetical protein [Candidatus Woesearchaeota archaeon]